MQTTDPIKQLTTRELLSAIIGFHAELSARGSLADAPADLTDALDAGDAAARELRDWLDNDTPIMGRDEWTGRASMGVAL